METSAPIDSTAAEKSRHSRLRTVDVARRVGCSVQHLRDLEEEGVLPAVERTPSGYRSWSELHVRSAVAYRELTRGVGPTAAKTLMRALHRRPQAVFLALLDDAHADVARERRNLRLAREAVAAITAEPFDAPRPTDAMTISELAGALGATTATLRHWEAEGLLAPQRAGRAHVRSYSPPQVRDARVIHQLRAAGYRIPELRPILVTLRTAQETGAPVDAALEARNQQLTSRSLALLQAAAVMREVLATTGPVDDRA